MTASNTTSAIIASIADAPKLAAITTAELAAAVADAQTVRRGLTDILCGMSASVRKEALYAAYDQNNALLKVLMDEELRRVSQSLGELRRIEQDLTEKRDELH